MRIFNILIVFGLFSASPLFAQGEVLNNDAIIELSNAGLGTEAIVAKIRSTAGKYDLSTSNLIALKRAKVSDQILAAMMETSSKPQTSSNAYSTSTSVNPLDPHQSGVYFLPSSKRSESVV